MVDNNTGNRGYLSDAVNEDGLYPIHGIAIGNNDITVGHKSGEPKLWRPDVLEEAADTLEGKDIVVNHENQDAYLKIGEVDEAKYDEERGVIYRGAIDDDELAEKIGRDWLEVSPRIKHTKAHEEIQGVKVPEAIRDFDNLSVVRRGAAGSNELNLGETEELSVEELQESFQSDDDSVSEYQTIIDEEVDELAEGVDYARWMFEDRNGAEGAAAKFGCGGTHAHEVDGKTWYMPCSSHDKFLKGMNQVNEDEMAKYSEDDYVTWNSSGGSAYGKIVDWTDDGTYDASIDGDVTVSGEENDPAALIQVYEETDDGWSPTDTMVGHKFSTLDKWNPGSVVSENSAFEEMQLEESRTPQYNGTETKSWGDIPADTLTYWVDALGYEAEQVDDLTEDQKSEIAQHTLLGDPEADNVRSLRFFPVVNANTGKLNRGALEAVRSGRGQSADIPQSVYESAFSTAGRLLNENFNTDVEVEMSASSVQEAVQTVELEVDSEELDEVYSDWSDAVNMTASQLRRWSGNPCSREASVDSEAVIERNLNLLETNKSEWGEDEIEDAKRTISFISRMSADANEPENPRDGSFGCPSNWAISLLNWAYNPFDSIPETPENEELDDVEELMKHSNAEEMERSSEEMRIASQLSSHSELMKSECLSVVDVFNPKRKTDYSSFVEILSKIMDQEEMEMMKSEMSKHLDEEEGEDSDSPLNMILR
jgi:hypothetical protein